MHESDNITRIKNVGEKRAQQFANLGIRTVGDLLRYFPRDYTDYSLPEPISGLMPEDTAVFAGTVTQKLRPYISPRYSLYRLTISDGTDSMLLTFFNSRAKLK